MLNTVYLALGSNIGDRQQYLDLAIEKLADYDDIEVLQVSSYINTQAVTQTVQPDYLNAVLEVRTLLSCRELLEITQLIEKQLGRKTKGNYDPRTIDIDILFFNHEMIAEDDLVVPHSMLHERRFVLEPLVEIAPQWVHPILNLTISELYQSCYEPAC